MTISLAFLSISLFYAITLNIFYFSKKRQKTKENKIFGYLVPLTLFIVILEFACTLIVRVLPVSHPVPYWLNKFYIISYGFFYMLFVLYITAIIESADKTELNISDKAIKIIKILNILWCMVLIISVACLKIYAHIEGSKTFSYGPGVNAGFIGLGVYMVGIIIYLIYSMKSSKRIRSKNIPILIFVVLSATMTIIQKQWPHITLLASVTVFVIFLIYHTIENPYIPELEMAKNVANEANSAKKDFLSSMSHEIRTPLNAIVGLSQVVQASDNIEEIHKDTTEMLIASQQLLELFNCILDVNKIEANQIDVVNSDYKVKETFDNLVKLINIMKREKQIEIVTKYSSDLPYILNGDLDKIKRIVTNLLTNAVKYTDRGFIYFNVNCLNNDNKTTLTIEVKDTGRGMDEVQQSKLFEQFYRLDSDKDSDISGAGLGLSITKSFVELLDGEIKVESVPGQGSTFTVIIPQKIVQLNSNQDMEVL